MARKLILMSCASAMFWAYSTSAQWTTQIIKLRPGWNAVFLDVQPEPRECDAVFAGLPIRSAWFYNGRSLPMQFIQDTNQPIVNPEKWLAYFPPSHPLAGACNLYSLDGGRPYLVQLPTNSATVSWAIHGIPENRTIDWQANTLNFVGFALPTNNPPTVQAFFAPSANLANHGVWQLDSFGRWISNAPSILMPRGEAFWIHPSGLPDYGGPLQLILEKRSGLEFGRTLTEQTLKIRNASTSSRHILLRPLASESPPTTAVPALAGPVPLDYWQNDFATGHVGWSNLTKLLIYSNLPPGGTWELRLAVRRPDMAPYTPPPGVTEVLYESLLEITDSAGQSRLLAPVTAKGMRETGGTLLASFGPKVSGASAGLTPPHIHSGLWVGSVSLNKVSQPESQNPNTALDTPAAFQFRLIMHTDQDGRPSLLQHVVQMWQPGTNVPAHDGTTNTTVIPGKYVLVANDARLREFQGSTLRDGQPAGRRFSTAAFSFREPLGMTQTTGDFGSPGSRTECVVPLSYTNVLNPFLHSYHPDHDNLSDRYTALTETDGAGGLQTSESFSIRRELTLDFAATDPDGLNFPGWGDRQIGGYYKETIYGLHKSALVLQGTFRLNHASREPSLIR
jgi:hypothetical protein